MLPLNPKSKMQAYPSHHFLELHLFPEKNQFKIICIISSSEKIAGISIRSEGNSQMS
jgi:hypothetical protein